MSITPIPDANFPVPTPKYSGVRPFRFWCQTVLPLVYDDSLSYYELLNKVVNYLNNVIADVAEVEEAMTTLISSFSELQNYVNTYFNSLDVQEEINAKLDEMAKSGALSDLISPFIPDLVTAWLNQHITPTSPPVDNTLTVSGAAADSKTVGDKFTSILNGLYESVDADGASYEYKLSKLVAPYTAYRVSAAGEWLDFPDYYTNTSVLCVQKFNDNHVIQTLYPYTTTNPDNKNKFKTHWRIVNASTTEPYTEWLTDANSFQVLRTPENYEYQLSHLLDTETVYYVLLEDGWQDAPTSRFNGVVNNIRSAANGVIQTWLDYRYGQGGNTEARLYWRFVLNNSTVQMDWVASAPPVDNTLSISGNAADAKATGDAIAAINAGTFFSAQPADYDYKTVNVTTPNASFRVSALDGWTDLPEGLVFACVMTNTRFSDTYTMQNLHPYSARGDVIANDFRSYWRIINTTNNTVYTNWHTNKLAYRTPDPIDYGGKVANINDNTTVFYITNNADWADRPSEYGGILTIIRSYSSGVLQVWHDYKKDAVHPINDMLTYWRFVLNDGTVYMPWQGGLFQTHRKINRAVSENLIINCTADLWTKNIDGDYTIETVQTTDCPGGNAEDALKITLNVENTGNLYGVISPTGAYFPRPTPGIGYTVSCWAIGTPGARFRLALHTSHVDDFTLSGKWEKYCFTLPFLGTESNWYVRFILFGAAETNVTVANWAVTPCDSIYAGKYFSIMGDSISSYRNRVVTGNPVYYPGSSDVNTEYRIWWKKSLVNQLGMNLLANNSWSGRCVTTVRDNESGFENSGACNVDQIEKLATSTRDPDVIVVKVGVNDVLTGFNLGARLGTYNGHNYNALPNGVPVSGNIIQPTDTTKIREAYAIMLGRIYARFPNAEVWCCTLNPYHRRFGFPGNRNEDGDFSYPSWKDVNDAIIEIAALFGCKIIRHDLCGINYYTPQYYHDWTDDGTLVNNAGLHPNYAGMVKLAEQTVYDTLAKRINIG